MTALTPAQVRDHARALILAYGPSVPPYMIAARLKDASGLRVLMTGGEVAAIADAIRTARITVDWDEE